MNPKATIFKSKVARWLILLAGIFAGQFLLYGPSLIGSKVLLPLDLLAIPKVYLPMTPEVAKIAPHNWMTSDLVYQWEPARQFAITEFQEGRLPMWTPYQYGGAPFIWPKFSPFMLLECTTRSPVILAWTQLFAAIIAGTGAYIFFRRVLQADFWPATLIAWCYPLTGFFVFWQGFPTSAPVYWLPWMLFTVDRCLRHGSISATVGLSVTTTLVLVSGALDVGGQVLIVSGLYAAWCFWDMYHSSWIRQKVLWSVTTVAGGWAFGFLLAAPYLLPLLEYTHTGARMEQRSMGIEERPPTGLSTLPQAVLPDMYGTDLFGSFRIVQGSQIESSATIYSGIVGTLFVAPLAWFSRRHRSINVFWCFLIFFSLSWSLNVPGPVQFLRLPGLNMMSHNRLVFGGTFAILAMMVVGLDACFKGSVTVRKWFYLPFSLLVISFCWCVFRSLFPPEPIASQIGDAVARGFSFNWIHNPDDVQKLQMTFSWSFAVAAILCLAGILGWLGLIQRSRWPAWAIFAIGGILISDLLWNAHGRSTQANPALYYPRVPMLDNIASVGDARIIGFSCFPPALPQIYELHDIRGYDAVDPAILMNLMQIAADPRTPDTHYAETMWFVPRINLIPPAEIRLSPVLDMFNVRYVIFRGPLPAGFTPPLQFGDYWALINTNALSRTFVPEHVQMVSSSKEALENLALSSFDPRKVAYIQTTANVPAACFGESRITSETPTDIHLDLKMKTAGLVVLADLWDKGWNAYLNCQLVPILRVNHAIRGVVVPQGNSSLEFRYEPRSFKIGLWLSATATTLLLIAMGVGLRLRRKNPALIHD